MNSLKPIVTEKAVMRIELENVLSFVLSKNESKETIKSEVEDMFKVKVAKVRTLVRGNRKYAYVKLKQEFPAIDVATKLGLI